MLENKYKNFDCLSLNRMREIVILFLFAFQ